MSLAQEFMDPEEDAEFEVWLVSVLAMKAVVIKAMYGSGLAAPCIGNEQSGGAAEAVEDVGSERRSTNGGEQGVSAK
jgi:hypothetical protein